MNKNYSPGPWSLEDGKRIHDVKGDHVADVYTLVWHKGMEDNERQEGRLANAQLISAAPDLVEALIGMAKVSAANEELKEVQAGWKGSAKELDSHCNKVAREHWKLHLTTFAHAALTKAGVLTKDK